MKLTVVSLESPEETVVDVFTSHPAALRYAVNWIIDLIDDGGERPGSFLDDDDAIAVYGLIIEGKYADAITRWNVVMGEQAEEHGWYFNVTRKTVNVHNTPSRKEIERRAKAFRGEFG